MDDDRPDAHLRDVDDGCGCTEIWEHTSAARSNDESDESDDDDTKAIASDED